MNFLHCLTLKFLEVVQDAKSECSVNSKTYLELIFHLSSVKYS